MAEAESRVIAASIRESSRGHASAPHLPEWLSSETEASRPRAARGPGARHTSTRLTPDRTARVVCPFLCPRPAPLSSSSFELRGLHPPLASASVRCRWERARCSPGGGRDERSGAADWERRRRRRISGGCMSSCPSPSRTVVAACSSCAQSMYPRRLHCRRGCVVAAVGRFFFVLFSFFCWFRLCVSPLLRGWLARIGAGCASSPPLAQRHFTHSDTRQTIARQHQPSSSWRRETTATQTASKARRRHRQTADRR